MTVDWTINIGTVLHAVIMLVALVKAYYLLDKRLALIEQSIRPLIRWWERRAEHGAAEGD